MNNLLKYISNPLSANMPYTAYAHLMAKQQHVLNSCPNIYIKLFGNKCSTRIISFVKLFITTIMFRRY